MNDLQTLDSNVVRDRILELFGFVGELEKDIFNYEEIKDKTMDQKTEYYKLAKASLYKDLDFLKQLRDLKNSDPQVELITALLNSLTKEEKNELIDFLVKLNKKKKDK